MPKHDIERSARKHKHSRHDVEEERNRSNKKPKRYASDEGNSSPETSSFSHKSSHSLKHHTRRKSPEVSHREIKREKHRDYPDRTTKDDARVSRKGIKREEDFDNRQEELRKRRLERSHRHERLEDDRVKQESHEDRGYNSQHHRDRRRNDEQRREERRRRDDKGEVEEAFKNTEKEGTAPEKEKPNLGLSGALTEDTNTYRGVVIKYNEPPEARIPKKKWRLYPFKGTEALKTLHLHRQSAYLLGRLRRIADIPIDHPSCSKQHAVLQFRMVECEVNGQLRRRVKPYVIDLGAANGTYVNNERIEAQRYVELKEKDVLKFGFSSREYVILHDKSDTTEVQTDSEDED